MRNPDFIYKQVPNPDVANPDLANVRVERPGCKTCREDMVSREVDPTKNKQVPNPDFASPG